MDFRCSCEHSRVPSRRWLRTLRRAARAAGLPYVPVPLAGWLEGAELVAVVRSLGGTVRPNRALSRVGAGAAAEEARAACARTALTVYAVGAMIRVLWRRPWPGRGGPATFSTGRR